MIAIETDTYQIEHARFREEQSSIIPTWLRELREHGLNRFMELGIPTTSDEEWRFTNIAPLLKEPFKFANGARPVGSQIDELIEQATLDDNFHRLVFVNGRFAEQWSVRHELPPGVIVENLASACRIICRQNHPSAPLAGFMVFS